jgi:hypothetical protein
MIWFGSVSVMVFDAKVRIQRKFVRVEDELCPNLKFYSAYHYTVDASPCKP